MTISDGSLPSNVGGGANVRNILRRVFAILKKNDWWKKLSMVDINLILERIVGAFQSLKARFTNFIRSFC